MQLTWDQVHDEMWRVERGCDFISYLKNARFNPIVVEALQRIIGVNPAFMRPPYGNLNGVLFQLGIKDNQFTKPVP